MKKKIQNMGNKELRFVYNKALRRSALYSSLATFSGCLFIISSVYVLLILSAIFLAATIYQAIKSSHCEMEETRRFINEP